MNWHHDKSMMSSHFCFDILDIFQSPNIEHDVSNTDKHCSAGTESSGRSGQVLQLCESRFILTTLGSFCYCFYLNLPFQLSKLKSCVQAYIHFQWLSHWLFLFSILAGWLHENAIWWQFFWCSLCNRSNLPCARCCTCFEISTVS